MINRKNIIVLNALLVSLGLLTTNLVAQKVYTEISVQYGMPIFGDLQTNETNITYYKESGNSYAPVEEIIKERKFSIGQGLQANVALGIMLSDYISVKIKGSYFQGRSNEDYRHNTYDVYSNVSISSRKVTLSGKGNYVGLSPMLMFHIPSSSPLSLSMGMGTTFALPSYHQSDSIAFRDGEVQYWEREYSSHLTIGAVGELGLLYKLNEKITLKAALQATILNFTPKSAEVVVFELNGQSSLRLLEDRFKYTEYGDRSKNYDSHSFGAEVTEVINENIPMQLPSFVVPLSNLGLEIGVVFGL